MICFDRLELNRSKKVFTSLNSAKNFTDHKGSVQRDSNNINGIFPMGASPLIYAHYCQKTIIILLYSLHFVKVNYALYDILVKKSNFSGISF